MRKWHEAAEFIALVGAVAAWPAGARAQQSAMPVIGYFSARSRETDVPMLAAFRQGLSESGYVEGTNVAIEFRWGVGQYHRLPAMAEDLVRRQVAVIVTSGGEITALAAKAATAKIPIVFNVGGDPVRFGLVASLNQPGGNLTGVTSFLFALGTKQIGLLRELVTLLKRFNDAVSVGGVVGDARSRRTLPRRDGEALLRNALLREVAVMGSVP